MIRHQSAKSSSSENDSLDCREIGNIMHIKCLESGNALQVSWWPRLTAQKHPSEYDSHESSSVCLSWTRFSSRNTYRINWRTHPIGHLQYSRFTPHRPSCSGSPTPPPTWLMINHLTSRINCMKNTCDWALAVLKVHAPLTLFLRVPHPTRLMINHLTSRINCMKNTYNWALAVATQGSHPIDTNPQLATNGHTYGIATARLSYCTRAMIMFFSWYQPTHMKVITPYVKQLL